MCVGAAQGALEHAVRYMNERVIGGRPLADLQGLQWKLADMAVQLEGARLLLARAVRLAGPGGTPPRARDGHGQDRRQPGGQVRLRRGHADPRRATAISREYPLERAYRDIRGLCIGAGTVEAQRNYIGLRVGCGARTGSPWVEGPAGRVVGPGRAPWNPS